MTLIIRKVTEKDNALLAKMIRTVFEEHDAPKEGTVYSDPTTDNLFKVFKNTQSILWVAEINQTVVGCCGVYPTNGLKEGCAELVKFYLSKESRGLGIGKKLLTQTITTAKELGYKEIYLESLPIYKTAIKMYENEKFQRISEPLGDSGHTSCDVWMLKKL